jgi:isopenicillin N synthase-like dioxygenase
MGIPENFWDDKLEKADPQLRLLRYHSIPKSVLEQPGNYRINPHTDYGLCTLLFQDQVGGLEVDAFHTGEFLPATPIKGTCVINVADLLQRLSNDKLRSTRHRVMLPQFTPEQLAQLGPDANLPDRYSTAFFVHPDPSFTIAPIVAEGEKSKYEPVNAGEWRTMITSRNHKMAFQDSKKLSVATVAAVV